MKNKKLGLILIILCITFGIIYINRFKNDIQYTFNSSIELHKFKNDFLALELNISKPIIDFANKFKESSNLLNLDNKKNEQNNKLININLADKEALKLLPGIGDTLADNIINYRNKNGKFKNIEEIKNVSRIGEKIFQKIKHLITI